MKKEIRTLTGEIRAVKPEDDSKELRFEGYAAVFNELSGDLGGFREKISQGAFSKAILEDDVRCLYNHDENIVLGRTKSGTCKLTEDDHGLHFEVIAPDTAQARDLHKLVERGDVNQCSFGFIVNKDAWSYTEEDGEVRTLLDVRLFDVSIVTYPAYEGTEAEARSLAEAEKRKETQRTPLSLFQRKLELIERLG